MLMHMHLFRDSQPGYRDPGLRLEKIDSDVDDVMSSRNTFLRSENLERDTEFRLAVTVIGVYDLIELSSMVDFTVRHREMETR